MEERRADLRRRVAWPVRVWLGEGVFALARAVDASPAGMRLAVSPRALKMIKVHDCYRVEFAMDAQSTECLAVVRYCEREFVGVVFGERIPALPEQGSDASAHALIA